MTEKEQIRCPIHIKTNSQLVTTQSKSKFNLCGKKQTNHSNYNYNSNLKISQTYELIYTVSCEVQEISYRSLNKILSQKITNFSGEAIKVFH